jgi:hypothetical protein
VRKAPDDNRRMSTHLCAASDAFLRHADASLVVAPTSAAGGGRSRLRPASLADDEIFLMRLVTGS